MAPSLVDNQPLDIWVTVLLFVVPMAALVARVVGRRMNKTFGADDVLIAVGAVFYVFQCATVIGCAVAGIGRKNEHITGNAQYIAAGRWFFFNILAYTMAATIVRLSILMTLLRIVSSRGYKYSIYVAMFFITAIGLQGVIFLLVQCKPIRRYWDKSIGYGSCFPSAAVRGNTISTTFVAAATDVFSAILPIVLLWKIQMNLKSKFLVCIMLSLGALAAVTIIVRLPAIVDLQDHQDSLYSVSVSILWGTAEVGIGITAASLSALRPLFRSWIGSSNKSTNPHTYALGTMPGGRRFQTDGMARIPDPSGSETWKGDNLHGFNAKTNISANPRLGKATPSEVSDDLHGDSNSETEILETQYRKNGIRMEKTYVVEATK